MNSAFRGARFAVLPLLLLVLAVSAGCGPDVRALAREARSGYISARAVLVGVEEFPSRMEGILRSGGTGAAAEGAAALVADARELQTTASSALGAAREKAELLAIEGGDKFASYADLLLELVDLGERLLAAHDEFVGISSSLLEGLPYAEDPHSLMPSLTYMDGVAARIRELNASMKALEEKTEALYRELTA